MEKEEKIRVAGLDTNGSHRADCPKGTDEGREIGDPVTDSLLQMLQKKEKRTKNETHTMRSRRRLIHK